MVTNYNTFKTQIKHTSITHIEVAVLNQKSERSCIYVLRISILLISTVLQDFILEMFR